MKHLLIADHDGGIPKDATLRALAAALQIGGAVDVLAAGRGADALAEAIATVPGVAKVLCCAAECLADGRAEPLAALIVTIAGSYDTIIAPATAAAKNVFPRVAALLDVMQVSDVTRVVSPDTFERPIYAGNAIQTVQSSDAKRVVTVRTAGFAAVAGQQPAAPIERIDDAGDPGLSVHVERSMTPSERPELTSARVVISGGRALGSADAFERVIIPLADALGAAVGASRAAVDAGYAPNDWQVGQTGKVVAPDLYVAVGISGAIQHLAGMKDSQVIVAINKDGEAPIFQVADYGLEADLFAAVPGLLQQLGR